jgi:protein KTI12
MTDLKQWVTMYRLMPAEMASVNHVPLETQAQEEAREISVHVTVIWVGLSRFLPLLDSKYFVLSTSDAHESSNFKQNACMQVVPLLEYVRSANLLPQLIIISGYPTSGKTRRATQLQDYFTTRIATLPPTNIASSFRAHLISDHTLSIERSVYNLETKDQHERSNNASEKDARATIYAAVKRVLTSKDIVILDGANYIKGWRYQLYCEAKAMRTPHCIVHVGTPVETARRLNAERLARRTASPEENIREEERPYETECWENLVYRYEEPNGMARWDAPLFTVPWDDPIPDCEAIWDAMVGSEEEGGKKSVRPNQATVLKAPSSEDYLYQLDKSTQEVLNRILEWAKDHPGEGGGEVGVGDGGSGDITVELPANPVGLPALQRLRRQFISLNRKNSVPVSRIKESFVGYLNDSFETA